MAQEDLQQEIDILKKKVEDLEKKSIQVNLNPAEKENIKNALFEGYFQSDKTEPTKNADTPYLKIIWKNKIIYIPFYV